MRLKRTALGALSVVALVGSSLALGATSTSAAAPPPKVTICHRTRSASNPYVKIDVAAASVDGDTGNDNGQGDHWAEHQGPIFDPATMTNGDTWGDIIPNVDDDGNLRSPTLNWPAGQAIWNTDGCDVPGTVTKEPGSLQVTKDVVGTVTGDSLNGFDIDVTCDTGTDVTLHFTNPPGGAQTVNQIPDGSTCWVVEQGVGSAGFTATVSYDPVGVDDTVSGGVVIASDETTDVTVTNTFGASSTATEILDVNGNVVTSAPVGSTVHDRATVDSSPSGLPTPTGTVDFTFYTGSSTCDPQHLTGTEADVALSGGLALSSDSPTLLADTSYSYRAHYNGDSTHTASDGPCEPLDPTTPTVPVPSPAEVSAEGVQVSPAAVQVSPATAVQASPALTG